MLEPRHSSSVGRYPKTLWEASPIFFLAASKIVIPSKVSPFHFCPLGLTWFKSCNNLTSQCCGYPPYGLVSTLFHHIYSCPLEKVQVDLQAIVHVWQPIQRFKLNTKANWD